MPYSHNTVQKSHYYNPHVYCIVMQKSLNWEDVRLLDAAINQNNQLLIYRGYVDE